MHACKPVPPAHRLLCCRGGRLRTSELAVADRGPRQAVLPEWVPQLQLHMLCAGESQRCPAPLLLPSLLE